MTVERPKALLDKAARDISGAFATRLCAIGVEFGLFTEISKSESGLCPIPPKLPVDIIALIGFFEVCLK